MVLIAPSLLAQPERPPQTPDPRAATEQYLASVPADARERGDDYFEGGYWLRLWSTLLSVAMFVALLHTGLSRRMRDAAERLTRHRALQAMLYAIMFIVVTTIVAFPLSLYSDFYREHQYGLSTQTLAQWLGDQGKAFALALLLGSLALTGLYAVLRRTPRTWWIWGAVFVLIVQILGAMIFPVFIAPVFNTYTRLENPAVRDPILRLARANGIHATEVWQVDASRQTTRISANVSGMFGTERITLNDNLLKRCSQGCIEAVMGHEMGHYVLNHAYEMVLAFGIVTVISFAIAQWAFDRLGRRYERRWGITGIGDPAGLPLLFLILTVYGFATFPVINTIIRTNESEADVFGLNAARQPDGFAEAALKIGEYRKLDPSPWEERIFYDHPSGRTRVFTAMQWKAEQK
jgi:STE24 endopeptidase